VTYNASAVKIYNASAVKIYNAPRSLVRFEKKTILFCLKNALAHCNAGVVVVNSNVAGLVSQPENGSGGHESFSEDSFSEFRCPCRDSFRWAV
jgi:hypothetical protein